LTIQGFLLEGSSEENDRKNSWGDLLAGLGVNELGRMR
jgi:hypothetical protein